MQKSYVCRAGHSLPTGTFPSRPKLYSATLRQGEPCSPADTALEELTGIKARSPHQNSAASRSFSQKEDLADSPGNGNREPRGHSGSLELFHTLGNTSRFIKRECALLVQLVASALLCAENVESEYSHFHPARLVLCAFEQISSPLYCLECKDVGGRNHLITSGKWNNEIPNSEIIHWWLRWSFFPLNCNITSCSGTFVILPDTLVFALVRNMEHSLDPTNKYDKTLIKKKPQHNFKCSLPLSKRKKAATIKTTPWTLLELCT